MGQNNTIIVTPNERNQLKNAGDRMPLGALYLSSALKIHKIPHRVIDLNHYDEGKLIKGIFEKCFIGDRVENVCMSFMSPSENQMAELSRNIKKVSPKTKIIVGGPHVTNANFSGEADHVIRGYGEHQLINILDDLGKIEKFDINNYSIPNRGALDQRDYNFELEGLEATTMITSRGCPNKCVFCANTNHSQTRRNIENIAEELDEIKDRGYKAVYLLDDTFLLDRQSAIQTAIELGKRGLDYRVEARANHIDDYMAYALAETRCRVAGIGIESGNNEILRKSKKGQRVEQVEKAVRLLDKYQIKTKGFFIIGLPGETEETARQTIDLANNLRNKGLAYADFYPLCPYPGSEVAKNPEKYGIEILDPNPEHYLNGGKELYIPTQTKNLKKSKIKELIMGAREQWR